MNTDLFKEQINSQLNTIKKLGDTPTALFSAVDLDNNEVIGFHCRANPIKSGDVDNYDHGVGIDKNTDLVYLTDSGTNFNHLDFDELYAIHLEHSVAIKYARNAIQNSAVFNHLGFDLEVNYKANTLTIVSKSTKETCLIIQNEEAEHIIDNANNMHISCGERASVESIIRSYICESLTPKTLTNVCTNEEMNKLILG